MAVIDEREFIPQVTPSTNVPAPSLHLDTSSIHFGEYQAQGLEQLGKGMQVAAQHWGEIAADDVANQFQEQSEKIQSDYLALKGKDALDNQAPFQTKLKSLFEDAQGKLASFDQRRQFDNLTRKLRAITAGKMDQHANGQRLDYGVGVNKGTIGLALSGIAANPDDEEDFKHRAADATNGSTKIAELHGAKPGDPMWLEAQNKGMAAAVETRILAIGAKDPGKAIAMADRYRANLGEHYAGLVSRFRLHADQQRGVAIGDSLLSGAPPPAGDDTKAVLRHFEGFREEPYWDVNHWRVGYGSDTITKADGTVEPVTTGTRVTREDAERDLERRASLSQKQVADAVGPEAWAKLDPKARASMTSVAYNYGRVPDELAAAGRTGDPQKIADSIRGLARHNNGVNSGRRQSEANNIAPGAEQQPRTQAEMIEEVQKMHLDPHAEASAIQRITHSYAQRQATAARDRAGFEMKVKDSTAEALNTGVTSNPIPEEEFTRHFGPQEGPEKHAQYIANVKFGADYKAMQTMSDVEMNQMVVSRINSIPAGAPGYARSLENAERLRKGAETLQKERREDPAGVVSRLPSVAASLSHYDPEKPETFAAVATARLQAQQQLGIEPEYRSPITKAEALKLTAPLNTMLPGQERNTLLEMGKKFQAMFGTEADKAFMYSLRAHHIDKETAQRVASVVKELSLGKSPSRQDARAVDHSNEVDAAERAVTAPSPRPQRAQPRMIGNPNEPDVSDPGGKMFQPPSPKAIGDLFGGVLTDKQFDSLYGPGKAQDIRKRYPAMRNDVGGTGGG